MKFKFVYSTNRNSTDKRNNSSTKNNLALTILEELTVYVASYIGSSIHVWFDDYTEH